MVDETTVLQQDAFGLAGRAGGVESECHAFRLRRRRLLARARRSPRWLGADAAGTDGDDLGPQVPSLVGEALIRHDLPDARVVEHEAQALVGIGGIERDARRSRLEDGQERDDERRGALQKDADHVPRLRAATQQVGGELVTASLQLPVGHLGVAVDDCDLTGVLPGSVAEELVQRGLGDRDLGTATGLGKGRLLIAREQREPGDLALGILDDLVEEL